MRTAWNLCSSLLTDLAFECMKSEKFFSIRKWKWPANTFFNYHASEESERLSKAINEMEQAGFVAKESPVKANQRASGY